jgi:hypothetical protein
MNTNILKPVSVKESIYKEEHLPYVYNIQYIIQ